jgi:ABC-type multidrug transport system fused ATPase/permease subunit
MRRFKKPLAPQSALDKVSFQVEQSQTLAIAGPSGAGKSTIASLILRFYDPESGKVYFDDQPANQYDLHELRQELAIVPQEVFLFGGTILENISYGKPGSSKEAIKEAAQQANAHDFIKGFPDAYDTLVGERGVQLSGGQRQRIAIARALLKNPSILILDEATSSLDTESEKLVQDALNKLMKNRTSIVIAHRLSTIKNADKILVLDQGKIIEEGTHESLLHTDNGLYKKLTELQLE